MRRSKRCEETVTFLSVLHPVLFQDLQSSDGTICYWRWSVLMYAIGTTITSTRCWISRRMMRYKHEFIKYIIYTVLELNFKLIVIGSVAVRKVLQGWTYSTSISSRFASTKYSTRHHLLIVFRWNTRKRKNKCDTEKAHPEGHKLSRVDGWVWSDWKTITFILCAYISKYLIEYKRSF